ncbi:hypothetical protein [Fructobacillus cardui]|uniref:hypothetical protein n=1 Tax=Fructobacillus cardui TaxID=2893170 RepID=UPI00200B75CF|nr:hypothetical protein [Fructobacillus cardui]MCK8628132.1 hypothetical protein [Fructobacillus cardui]
MTKEWQSLKEEYLALWQRSEQTYNTLVVKEVIRAAERELEKTGAMNIVDDLKRNGFSSQKPSPESLRVILKDMDFVYPENSGVDEPESYFGVYLRDEIKPEIIDDMEEDMALMTDYLGGSISSQEDDPKLTNEEIEIIHNTGADWLLEDVNIDSPEKNQILKEVKADSSNNDTKGLNMMTPLLKKQRDEILESGALEASYSNNVKSEMLDLDPDLLAKTFADEGVVSILTAEAQKGSQNHQNEFDNVLVTEMVRNMELEDFEDVSDFFGTNQKDYNEKGYKSLNPSPVNLDQSTYKQLKKEIVDDTALNVGYLQEVKSDMLYLDPNILEKVLSNEDTAQALSSEANKANQGLANQFDNILVTEMTRELNYQDFKSVAPKFMNFAKSELSQQEDLDFAASQLENNITL